jgi:hypothetical protein
MSWPRRRESQWWVGQAGVVVVVVRASRVWWRVVREWVRRVWRMVSMWSGWVG